MNLFDRVRENLWRKRDKLMKGGVNCIPWGLPRFEEAQPGIEQRNYYIMSGNTKAGKSQITDFLFVHNAYSFSKLMEGQVKIKIKYFSIEMSIDQKIVQCLSHRLYVDSGMKIRLSPRELRSTNRPLSTELTELVNTYQPYFEEFLDNVEFIDNIKNPYGIFKEMQDYALSSGVQHKKEIEVEETGAGGAKVKRKIKVDDYYAPNNPNEYVMAIVDNANILTTEKGMTSIFDAINDLSGRHFIMLRNKYGQIPVLIQQQSASMESVENFKHSKLIPSFNGLGDSKLSGRD